MVEYYGKFPYEGFKVMTIKKSTIRIITESRHTDSLCTRSVMINTIIIEDAMMLP